MRITSEDQLRELYRQPTSRAAGKTRDRIDEATARFISLCPLAILSTAGADGTVDASPRGGPAGFIKVLDERHVAVPDLGGNNRLDSFKNIIANPHAGLLLMVPGKEETVRINGPAYLSIDADLLASFTADLRPPKIALVVETQELFAHCAKAFRRSGVWKPDSWAPLKTAPDLAEIYECQFPSTKAEEMRATLEQVYANDLAQD